MAPRGFKIRTRENVLKIFKFQISNGFIDNQQQLQECSAATGNIFKKSICPGRGRHRVSNCSNLYANLKAFAGSFAVAALFKKNEGEIFTFV